MDKPIFFILLHRLPKNELIRKILLEKLLLIIYNKTEYNLFANP